MVGQVHKFRQIANDLREEILNGGLAPGEELMSENELAVAHGTTRQTVRKALALLRAEGRIVSEQGKGTFVRPRPHVKMLLTGANYRANRETGVSNFNAETASQGRKAQQEITFVGEVAPSAEIADLLQIRSGQMVIARNRLFTVDGAPMQFCNGYYPADLFRDTPVAKMSRIKGGVHAVIEDPQGPIASRVVQFVEDLDIRLPLTVEAEALEIPDGVPVARVLRTAFDDRGRALEVLDSIVPTDRYAFRYVIDVP
jgi:GntR family transcriptional regulator